MALLIAMGLYTLDAVATIAPTVQSGGGGLAGIFVRVAIFTYLWRGFTAMKTLQRSSPVSEVKPS